MLNDNIKLLIEQSGVSDKLLGNIVQIKDEKLDSVTIKTNPKCVYTISKDIILKQCTKCKQFKDLKSFAGFGNGSTCMFKLDYRCKLCSKRSKEKEIEYYHKKMIKKNPNYIPLAERPVKVKEVKTKRKYNKKNKIVENLAATNLTEADFVDKTILREPVQEIKVIEIYPLENKVDEEDISVIEAIVDKIEPSIEPETKIPIVKKKRVYKKKVKVIENNINEVKPLEHEKEVSAPSQINQIEKKLSENQSSHLDIPSVSNVSEPAPKSSKRSRGKKTKVA